MNVVKLEEIKKLIHESGKSTTKLAAAIGCTVATFYNKLNGTTEWNVRELVLLARALGLSQIGFMRLVDYDFTVKEA